jgi:membrane associated rhomboid family serine protease
MALFGSIWDDIRHAFRIGNMVTRLVIINFGIFIAVNLVFLLLLIAKGPDNASIALWEGLQWLCIPASGRTLLFQPWSPVTHMFLHENFWHVLNNIIGLYLFGVIVSDLIGDRRILPIYLLGGLFGGLMFMASAQFAPYVGSYALGASGAVMALAGTALILAPDYRVRLFLFGEVKVEIYRTGAAAVRPDWRSQQIQFRRPYCAPGRIRHGLPLCLPAPRRARLGRAGQPPARPDRSAWFSLGNRSTPRLNKRKPQKAYYRHLLALPKAAGRHRTNPRRRTRNAWTPSWIKIKASGYESLSA